MRNIPFSPPDISELEIKEVCEAMRSGWITTGPRTKELEKRLAEYCHTEKCVCLSSATAAEELILRLLGIGEGDEVIVPAYTYTASVSAAVHVGAKIVFVDSQPDSVEMDYAKMEAAITEKTKAIVAVDLGGIICDYDRIYQAVENKKALFVPGGNTDLGQMIQKSLGRVAVLADSAHALGANRHGKMAGEIADFTSFSSMQSRTLRPQRAAPRHGKRLKGSTTRRSTSSSSSTACTDRARTRLLKLTRVLGSMTLSALGISAI